jgi:hypothetical protein
VKGLSIANANSDENCLFGSLGYSALRRGVGPCPVILHQSEKCADLDTRGASRTGKNNKMYGGNVTVIVHSEIDSICQ